MDDKRLTDCADGGDIGHRSDEPAYFATLVSVEDRHFRFRARNRVIAALVEQMTSMLAPGYRVLELRCETGNVLRILERVCPSGIVVGMDLFAEGLQQARARISCLLVQGDVRALPFEIQFDLIGEGLT